MNRLTFAFAGFFVGLEILLTCCSSRAQGDPRLEDPPLATVERKHRDGVMVVEHPEHFPLTTASNHAAAPELSVTGVVSADVSRNVPVISLASGRILEIHARLGDTVTKGQLLMRVQSADIAAAFRTTGRRSPMRFSLRRNSTAPKYCSTKA